MTRRARAFRSGDGRVRPLASPVLRVLVVATAFSSLSSGVLLGALPLAVATMGGGPVQIGLVSSSLYVWWLVSVPLGAYVDLKGPGPVLRAISPLRTLAVLVIGAAGLFHAGYTLIIVGALLYGLFNVVASNASSALPALLLDKERYDEGYALVNTVNRIASLVLGPAIGATLLVVQPGLPFGLAAVSMVGAYVAYARVFGDERARSMPPSGESRQWRLLVAGGLSHMWRDRFLRAVMLTLTGVVIAEELVQVVVAPYVRNGDVHGHWQEMLGLTRSAAGVMAIVAALCVKVIVRRWPRMRIMAIAAAGAAICPAILAIGPHAPTVIIALGISAAAEAIWVPLMQSETAARTPGHLMARTRAAILFVTWGTLPVTSLAGGAVSQVIGVQPVLLVASAAAICSCTFGIWRCARISRPDREPTQAPGDLRPAGQLESSLR